MNTDLILPDWRKHLKCHIKAIFENKMLLSTREEMKTRRFILNFFREDSKLLNEWGENWEYEDFKRSLELCNSLDEYRNLWFAGNPLTDDTIINIPLKITDIQILFKAVDDQIDSKILQIIQKNFSQWRRKGRRKNENHR